MRIRKRNSLAIEWCLSCCESMNISGDIGNQMNIVKLSQKHADVKELKKLLCGKQVIILIMVILMTLLSLIEMVF